jgi:hypothetical protein
MSKNWKEYLQLLAENGRLTTLFCSCNYSIKRKVAINTIRRDKIHAKTAAH